MRRWLVLISAALHLALVFGLFVAGFWKLEQLDRPKISVALAQPLPPPPAPAGGAAPTKAPTFNPKTPKKPTVDITQPEPKHDETPKPVPSTTGGGEGSGEGSGRGSGDPLSTGPCTEDCGPGEGSGSAVPEKKQVVEHHEDVVVPPSVIRGMRISGDTQPHPSDNDKTAMARDGKDRIVASFKTCVDERGSVASVSMLKSSGYAGYDNVLSQTMFGWRYKPYEIGGQAVRACGIVTFIYQIK
ncbi:MAG: hypothetical protein JO257_16655 [Deltaproteobacteria bacterium]|nr:hypothetical protein [Deltaproteobacteria bacterium]